MELRAYAKVNLSLNVLSLREDGYHEVDYLLQSIDLFDTLFIERANALSLHAPGVEGSAEGNLVYRAAAALKELSGHAGGAQMRLEKHIPIAAGLGGGSADAAAALFGLNELWGLGLSLKQLQALGASIGVDIPFCLAGGLVRARGKGTCLQALESRLDLPMVILQPCEGISAKQAYSLYDDLPDPLHPDVNAAAAALLKGSFQELLPHAANGLQAAVAKVRPEILKGIDALRKSGASQALMSGSGSCVLGLYESTTLADAAFEGLKQRFATCIRTGAQPLGVQIMRR